MDSCADASNVLHQAIAAGNLKRVKRLVEVKTMDTFQVSTGIIVAMNAKLKKKVRNEIIKVFISHPKILVNITVGISQNYSLSSEDVEEIKGTSLLHMWIEEGDLDLVDAVIKHPTLDPEDASKGIIVAMESEHLCKSSNEKLQNDVIKTLLKHPDVDVNFKRNGFSLLHIAISLDQFKTVETLLQHPKVDVNECATEFDKRLPGEKMTPLIASIMYNSTTDITKILLEHPKTDVNKTDADLRLPLNCPVYDEKTFACFEMLLNHSSIDVNVKDQCQLDTPLIVMAQSKKFELDSYELFYEEKAFKLLLNSNKVNLEIKDDYGQNILHHMMISILLNDYRKNDNLATHKARFGTWYEIISETLERYPNLITLDEDEGNTPIDIANKHLPDRFHLMKDIIEKYFDKITKESTEEEPPKTVSKHNENKCCWYCDAEDVKLYKCTGCKKAYYCSRDCITHDWPVHGGYCLRKQKKKQYRKSS